MNKKDELQIKLEVAESLYHEGRITRGELFKHEVALSLMQDAGPVVLAKNPEKPDERSAP